MHGCENSSASVTSGIKAQRKESLVSLELSYTPEARPSILEADVQPPTYHYGFFMHRHAEATSMQDIVVHAQDQAGGG